MLPPIPKKTAHEPTLYQMAQKKYNTICSYQLKHKHRPKSNIINLEAINQKEEKKKFMELAGEYNPRLFYQTILPQREFITPHKCYLDLALDILSHQKELYFSQQLSSQPLSKDQVRQMFNEYVSKAGVSGKVQLAFRKNQSAPACIQYKKGYKIKSQVVIADPIQYSNITLGGLLEHEIGTHLLRRLNHRSLSSNIREIAHKIESNKEQNLSTEEGLACINQLVNVAMAGGRPLLYRPALMYVAAIYSGQMPFKNLYKRIRPYCIDEEQAWKVCIAVKGGGIEDTSTLQCYCKPQVYFRGAIDILIRRHQLDFQQLHSVTYSMGVVMAIGRLLKQHDMHYKVPLLAQPDKYMVALDRIATENYL